MIRERGDRNGGRKRNREKLDGRGSDGGMVMSGGREDGGYVACREHGWRDEGVMEGWWEYREKEERGEQQWEGRRRNTMSYFVFILIHGSVRGGRYLLIILLYYLTLKAKKKVAPILGADFCVTSIEGLGVALDTRFENER